jgi:hypothetical protein
MAICTELTSFCLLFHIFTFCIKLRFFQVRLIRNYVPVLTTAETMAPHAVNTTRTCFVLPVLTSVYVQLTQSQTVTQILLFKYIL